LEEVKLISEESYKMQSLLKHEHEQHAEMREMKATYEAEMLEHEHEENARRRSENARNGFHRNEDFLVGDHGRNGSHH